MKTANLKAPFTSATGTLLPRLVQSRSCNPRPNATCCTRPPHVSSGAPTLDSARTRNHTPSRGKSLGASFPPKTFSIRVSRQLLNPEPLNPEPHVTFKPLNQWNLNPKPRA